MILTDFVRPISENIELVIKHGSETIYEGYNHNDIPDAHLYAPIYVTTIDEYTLFISVETEKELYKNVCVRR